MNNFSERFGADDPTIVDAHVPEITDAMREGYYDELPRVMVAYSNNVEEKLFDFFPEEIAFTKEELIGLTKEQALKLKEKKMNEV